LDARESLRSLNISPTAVTIPKKTGHGLHNKQTWPQQAR
jgi:hypothetical protein